VSLPEPGAEPIELSVAAEDAGSRLDAFLARQFPGYSRVVLRRAINAAAVLVAGKRVKAAHRLRPGEQVSIRLPDLPRESPLPEDIPIQLLFEDEHLAVVNKPAGMVVHPGRGHWRGTLAAALAFHLGRLSQAAGPLRPGIVHRIDRDTSGLLVVAKTDADHMRLAEQFERRSVEKQYFAIVVGVPDRDCDVVREPIGPHPYQREKMAIRRDHPQARPAETQYEVVERFAGFAAIKAIPKTGRTHQIRLHLSHIGCPVLCDRLYSGRSQLSLGELRRTPDDGPPLLARQALHAWRLGFAHPATGEALRFEAPLPEDLLAVLAALRER
jgi:23S rRNA pseudouridine1911/1915/1917 synthase